MHSVAEVARACVPSSLRPLMRAVGTEGAAVTALAGVTIALLVPFTVSLVDEFYLLKASAKAKRALKAARSRDLARQQRASPWFLWRHVSRHSIFGDEWKEVGGLGGVGKEVKASERKN